MARLRANRALELVGWPELRLTREESDGIVESALRQVLLWDQVKDKLDNKATGLSLEAQQKLLNVIRLKLFGIT